MNSKNRKRTLARVTAASDPGQLTLSHDKLRVLRPDLYGLAGTWKSIMVSLGKGWAQRSYIESQLQKGDSRAAVVVSTRPLLIAAYTDELDCIALLRFPQEFIEEYDLSQGTRLLTVNRYGEEENYDPDLIPGPNKIDRWTGFHPLIADFLTDDDDRLEYRKREISEDEWQRAEMMGIEYLQRRPGTARDGRPVYSSHPARPRKRSRTR